MGYLFFEIEVVLDRVRLEAVVSLGTGKDVWSDSGDLRLPEGIV